MLVRDLVSVVEDFQRSVNIVYDLNDITKAKVYIPTERAEMVTLHVLDAVSGRSSDGATMLMGSFGTGKSHLVTVIGSLFTKAVPADAFEPIVSRLSDHRVKAAVREELSQTRPLLVVPISCSAVDDPARAILMAVKRRLQSLGLVLDMDTDYEAAQKIMYRWKDQFPHTYTLLGEALQRKGKDVEGFHKDLADCIPSALQEFKMLYPSLTSGAPFESSSRDVGGVLDALGRSLSVEYRGIFLIMDEFNKVLDSAAKGEANLNLIQDLAELASRNGKGYVLHLLTTSHRALSQYTGGFSRKATEQWQAIEGRFKLFDLTTRQTEAYSLISRVLVKDAERVCNALGDIKGLTQLREHSRLNTIFEGLHPDDVRRLVVDGCFPLHPLTSYCLPRIASRVAQNERTLFTFLAGKDDSPLSRVLEEEMMGHPLVMAWQIWDYFSLQLERSSDPEIRKVFSLITNSLESLATDDNDERRIVKTLGVFLLANNKHNLPATRGLVAIALFPQLDANAYSQAVKKLVDLRLLLIRKSDEIMCLVEPIGVDVERLVDEWLGKNAIPNVLDKVSDLFGDQYLIPHEYNLEVKMTRYLAHAYCDSDNIRRIIPDSILSASLHCADGIMCYLVPRSFQEVQDLRDFVRECVDPRVIFALPKEPRPVADAIARTIALMDIQRELGPSDARVEPLLDLYIEDAKRAVTNILGTLIQPSRAMEYYHAGCYLGDIASERALSVVSSKIMRQVYSEAPVINNELINKQHPTVTSRRARNMVLDLVLKDNRALRSALPTSQEVFMFDSLLVRPGLYEEIGGMVVTRGPCASALQFLRSELTREQGNPVCFDRILAALMSPPFGVRKGIIPVLLTVTISDRIRNCIAIQNRQGRECEVTAELFDRIVATPHEYYSVFGHWDEQLETWVSEVAKVFSSSGGHDLVHADRFSGVADALNKWYTTLPRFARETAQVGELEKNLRRIARVAVKNPRRMLTVDLPIALGVLVDDPSSRERLHASLGAAKKELEDALETLTERVAIMLRESLAKMGVPKGGPLSMARAFVERSGAHVWSNSVLARFGSLVEQFRGYDDTQFVRAAASSIAGVRLEDWADSTLLSYEATLSQMVRDIQEVATTPHAGSRMAMQYITENRIVAQSVVPECPVSTMGRLLQSDLESALYDFNDAIPFHEKRQVLINILLKYI